MSNFVERLVARSTAGAAASGIAVLTPRPVSRFENAAGINPEANALEAQVEDTSPGPVGVDQRPPFARTRTYAESSDHAVVPPRSASPPEQRAAERKNVPAPGPQTPRDEARRRSPVAAGPDTDLHAEVVAAPVMRHVEQAEIVPVAEDADAAPDDGHFRELGQPQARPASPNRVQRATFVDVPVRSTILERTVRAAPMSTRREAGLEAAPPPPAPVVSIGKIEVQFLPRESPLPAPRPEAPRTRGFETYARARRGEPR
jgi:hypothetical protein